jgi:methyl-accepting chemotaxis protein
MNLRTKILVTAGTPFLVLLVLVSALLLHLLYDARLDAVQNSIRAEATGLALVLEGQNKSTVDAASALALAQETGMFGDRDASVAMARKMLEDHPELTGAYVAYEAGADAAFLSPDVVLDPKTVESNGRFGPYWFRSGQGIELTPLVDMDISYYYRGLRNRVMGQPEDAGISLENGISRYYESTMLKAHGTPVMITEPYLYEGKLIVEQTAPIMIDGRFQGIGGVDRALDDLEELLSSRDAYRSAEFLLISTRGRVISATGHAELRTLPLENTPYVDWLRPTYTQRDFSEVRRLVDPVSGRKRFVSAAEVPTGRWILLVSVDEEEILAPVESAVVRTLLLVVAGLLAIILVVFLLSRSIVRRVTDAVHAAQTIAAGDLTVEINSDARDETGALLVALNEMVSSLGALVRRLKTSSVQLFGTSTELSAASNRQDELSNDVGASTAEIAASTTQISATAQELLKVMGDIAAASRSAAATAADGRGDLETLQATMENLLSATTVVGSRLKDMASHAEGIGTVVETITKVAEQTNLLSLNAAIEAEKAGEYGLGFAVVAREVRRLADQTAVATLDIERLIAQMQQSVSVGVTEMVDFTETVRSGVSEVGKLGDNLGQVIEGVESLQPRLESAHEGMQSQAAGAGQINQAMQQLRDISLESGKTSSSLQSAADALQSAVEELSEEIARFRTR